MKIFFIGFILLCIQSQTFATSCGSINTFPGPADAKKFIKMLGPIFKTIEITDSNKAEQKTKPIQLTQKSTGKEINLLAGETINPGDVITTGKNQTVTLTFFMPQKHNVKIQENSKLRINNFTDEPGESLFDIQAGGFEFESPDDRRVTDPDQDGYDPNEPSTFSSPLSERGTHIGTKYSVDLNDAIAEASGSDIQTETYSVDKGSIKIKLRRANKFTKLNIKSKRKDFKVSKNGVFKLKAGQKARLKVNRKTKVADIEVIEP